MLTLDGVSVQYGAFRVLQDISITVGQGELVVLLGANGAGKSTLFRTISGLHRVTRGRIVFDGDDISKAAPAKIVARGIAHCPEGRRLFPDLSVAKNLMLGAYTCRGDQAAVARTLARVHELFPILVEKADQPAGSLSGGQQQMVAIGRALMGRPRLLMLDEPTLGLAPLVVRQVLDAAAEICRSGTTVLLAEQNAHAALAIADRGYVIETGHITTEGTREALMSDDEVRRAYVGA
ncbi:MAG: ABC transporter ATP-binding protein [Tistrella sp.]|jgi:branched-chain amino acid transport system ATP-binding protein|uniref:ABC transporter ATP-binding protein n=1 Tax=Tistrella mobilis TaxID=171437 RepID=A0A162LCA5_9PROT|nr:MULTISPECIES: ABC transporter ATP-binding protein [Tistrella]KYO54343.1 ABC transporter ATP-binding protein [Tistrella mobilis]MAD38430.1 ABC transporter ATP-binding protein [Tistrella sp.]MBA77453.1 ABC transporter ATP-binding protein [Tistrella sp.]HAE49134.1 ABC transporter ATP-binding protein [Tistrella mobilis]